MVFLGILSVVYPPFLLLFMNFFPFPIPSYSLFSIFFHFPSQRFWTLLYPFLKLSTLHRGLSLFSWFLQVTIGYILASKDLEVRFTIRENMWHLFPGPGWPPSVSFPVWSISLKISWLHVFHQLNRIPLCIDVV